MIGETDSRRDIRTGGRRQPGVAGGEIDRLFAATGEGADGTNPAVLGRDGRMLAALLAGDDAAGRLGSHGATAGIAGDAGGRAAAEAMIAAAFTAAGRRGEGAGDGGKQRRGKDKQKREQLQQCGGPAPWKGRA